MTHPSLACRSAQIEIRLNMKIEALNEMNSDVIDSIRALAPLNLIIETSVCVDYGLI